MGLVLLASFASRQCRIHPESVQHWELAVPLVYSCAARLRARSPQAHMKGQHCLIYSWVDTVVSPGACLQQWIHKRGSNYRAQQIFLTLRYCGPSGALANVLGSCGLALGEEG